MTDTAPETTPDARTSTPAARDFTDAAGNALVPTAVDAAGTERVVGRPVDNWTPAPVEPDPKHVEALARHNAREAEASAQRQGALTDTDRLDDTAQPLVEANEARDAEQEELLAEREDDKGEDVLVDPADGVPLNAGEAADLSTPADESTPDETPSGGEFE